VSVLFRSVFDSSGPMIGGLAVFGAALLCVFVTYLGVAMTTALFHRDRAHRAIALEIFRDLLALFKRSSR
jgi:fatty-acid desaturase